MKQFFKFVFASFFGMMLFSIVTGLFALFTIAGMIASQDTTKEPEDNSVLVLNLSGQMSERSENNFLSQLQGSQINSLGLDDMLEGIRKAKDNDKIKGIYIEAGAFASDSYASMQALRKALLDFKKSRKWIMLTLTPIHRVHTTCRLLLIKSILIHKDRLTGTDWLLNQFSLRTSWRSSV